MKETLSDNKIGCSCQMLQGKTIFVYDEEDVKEKIQNAQRRLRIPIEAELGVAKQEDTDIAKTVRLLLEKLLRHQDKVFSEEFGEKLL